jgi:hypothetical protein
VHEALIRVMVSLVGVSLCTSTNFAKFADAGSFLGGIAVCLQEKYILDLTPAVSGSAIADDMDAGLLKKTFFVFFI